MQDALSIQQLRQSPSFIKVYNALLTCVTAAKNDLRLNTNPHADAYYKLIWTSREDMLNALDQFIDSTIQKRRDAMQEFLRSLGIDEDKIERNLDSDLDFLTPGGPHVNNAR